MVTRIAPLLSAVALLLSLLGACCPAPGVVAAPTASAAAPPVGAALPSATPVATSPAPVDPVPLRAAQLVDRAKAAEPQVTALLTQLAAQLGGEMVKLQFRLKTLASTERKLRKLLAGRPAAEAATISLDDSLRYTMRVDDEPAGHYLAVMTETLRALEQRGHRVVRLKNYWPLDDNYSGINGVLAAADGMEWELQFHTAASLETQDATHAWYEEFRRPEASIERQRELFDLMTKAWNQVPVPQGVLDPGRIHPRSERLNRPRP